MARSSKVSKLSTQDIAPGEMPAESLAVLLSKIQIELSEIAGLMKAIEPVIDGGAGAPIGGSGVEALQGLDLAIQKAHGLADFLAELSAGMPQDWLIDVTTALNVLKLTELQNRLHPARLQNPDEGFSKAVGDVDLF